MKKILKGLKWVVLHIEEIIAVTALAVMLCSIMLNVIMRYVFRNPTSWADELAMICMAYVTFVGGAVAYKHNLHFGIDFLVDKMPVKVQMAIRRITNFVFIPLFGYTTFLGIRLMLKASKRMIYSGWSYKIIDASLPIGFLSMTIYAIIFFVMSFTDKEKYENRFRQTYEEDMVDEELVKASEEMFNRVDAENAEGSVSR